MKKLLWIVLSLTGVMLTGCSLQRSPEPSVKTVIHKEAPTPTNMNPFQKIKVTSEKDFLTQMIPHHQEAIDTSLLISKMTTNGELKKIALSIAAGQTKEITTMQTRLQKRYSGAKADTPYMAMMPSFSGLTGAARDTTYIKGMIDHHIAAIIMAEQAMNIPKVSPELAHFAQQIITTQSSEIIKFQKMLSGGK